MKIFLSLLFLIPITGNSQMINQIQEVDTLFLEKNIFEGNIYTIEWNSKYLDELRTISIYEPPLYNSNSEYGIVFVTDGITQYIADDIEHLILNKIIEPIIIVGINWRRPQEIDSIYKDLKIDFRRLDFFKELCILPSDEKLYEDSNIVKIISNRYEKFSGYIANEVIPYVKQHYSVKMNKNSWTLGGFSNGGAFVYGFSCDYPNYFGNSIVMSPGGTNNYDILKSKCKYFICVGKDELEGFSLNSREYIDIMITNNIPFIHKTYNCGHDWNMWMTFYLESIKEIYKY
jgi:enterochelin esterase-like enzyme